MADQPQPNFDTMAAHLDTISHEHASVVAQLRMVQNIPAFNAGDQVLNAIVRLSRRIDEHFEPKRLQHVPTSERGNDE